MSATHTPPDADAPVQDTCPRCGARLRPDQDWCLSCGAAVTTEVAGARGWRTPVAIVGVVLVVAAAALVFAFAQLSTDANQVAQAPTPAPVQPPAQAAPTPAPAPPAPAAPAPSPTPAPGGAPGGAIAEWPAGTSAYTVVLFSGETRREAEAKARGFQSGGTDVGLLHSNDFSTLRAGYWVVFSGQYDTRKAAQDAAKGLQSPAPGAYARQVKPK